MVTHKNDVVRFKPPIEIDGRTEYYVASERFPDYVGHLRGAVKDIDSNSAGYEEGEAFTPAGTRLPRVRFVPESRLLSILAQNPRSLGCPCIYKLRSDQNDAGGRDVRPEQMRWPRKTRSCSAFRMR